MVPVSIVIITKNVADILTACIDKAKLITDDIVVIYNGSSHGEDAGAGTVSCRIYNEKWDGYGANKNKGIAAAKYNWVLSIDADEKPDEELIKALHLIKYENPRVVYDIKFKSYFGEKPIKFGRWGRDHHIRLFNRTVVRWNETMVHETLVIPTGITVKKVGSGYLHHYSVKNKIAYKRKSEIYAKLSAEKYLQTGKSTTFIKLHISPLFGFIKNYIICLGFLDGREGWDIALTTVKNTRLKYRLLSRLQTLGQKKQITGDCFALEY